MCGTKGLGSIPPDSLPPVMFFQGGMSFESGRWGRMPRLYHVPGHLGLSPDPAPFTPRRCAPSTMAGKSTPDQFGAALHGEWTSRRSSRGVLARFVCLVNAAGRSVGPRTELPASATSRLDQAGYGCMSFTPRAAWLRPAGLAFPRKAALPGARARPLRPRPFSRRRGRVSACRAARRRCARVTVHAKPSPPPRRSSAS